MTISPLFFFCASILFFFKNPLESGLLEINKVSELSDELKLKLVY